MSKINLLIAGALTPDALATKIARILWNNTAEAVLNDDGTVSARISDSGALRATDMIWTAAEEGCKAGFGADADCTAERRASCLADIRRLGAKSVRATYSGYGDSGNVDDVTLDPQPATMPEGLMERLCDLLWDVAYNANPGFEINDGGNGVIDWWIASDEIRINHRGLVVSASTHGPL